MPLKIPALLDAILEATAAEATAKARIATLRATLETEARRRWAEEGAAPSWNAPKAGKVRFDPPGDPTPIIVNDERWTAWVAEQYPAAYVATIVVGPEHVDAAAQALEFAGVEFERVAGVGPAWSIKFLETLEVEADDVPEGEPQTYMIADPASGEVVPGLSATRGNGKLVVSLDRDRRARALEDATMAAELTIEEASQNTATPEAEAGPFGGPGHIADEDADRMLADLPHGTETEAQAFARTAPSVIAIMETGSREDLRRYAKAHGIAAHGTKGDLAIRLSAAGKTVDTITGWVEDNNPQEPTP